MEIMASMCMNLETTQMGVPAQVLTSILKASSTVDQKMQIGMWVTSAM